MLRDWSSALSPSRPATDEVIPGQKRIEALAEGVDLEEAYNTERHLLYVACTRARVHLLVVGVEPVSEFLTDLGGRSADFSSGAYVAACLSTKEGSPPPVSVGGLA